MKFTSLTITCLTGQKGNHCKIYVFWKQHNKCFINKPGVILDKGNRLESMDKLFQLYAYKISD